MFFFRLFIPIYTEYTTNTLVLQLYSYFIYKNYFSLQNPALLTIFFVRLSIKYLA
jgi:hypothetical protein